MNRYHTAYAANDHSSKRFHPFRAEPDAFVHRLRAVGGLALRVWLRFYHRFEVVGQEQLQTNRSLVIVANHSSHLDTLCLLAALPVRKLHRVFPAAAADYFFQRPPRTWIAGAVNAFPFGRRIHVRRGLSMCRQLISQPGNILIMFPEGTRSTTGRTQPFKLGVSALVAGRDVTVVPCYLDGAFNAWPKSRRLPRPKKIRLIVGAPRNYLSYTADKAELGMIASELEQAVKLLGGAQ